MINSAIFVSTIILLSTLTCNVGLFLSSTADCVYYDRLGCFSMNNPWSSLLRALPAPMDPLIINTRVYFYRKPDERFYPQLIPRIDLKDAPYNPRHPTVLIIHGFASHGNGSWQNDLKNRNANVFIVDWGDGARLLNYMQVASNTRVVGKELALLVEHLIENYGTRLEDVHLIGHSLGAQISSYIGKEIPGIGRLTALDPAQPGFEGFNKLVRLDKSDAEFVEVFHTHGRPFIPTLGFGMMGFYGHVDVYFNGGFSQPGCLIDSLKIPEITSFADLAKYPVEIINSLIGCPHNRVLKYLIEAYDNPDCIFWAYKSTVSSGIHNVINTVSQGVWNNLVTNSHTCSVANCFAIGIEKTKLRGVFQVTTKANAPYCYQEREVRRLHRSRKNENSINIENTEKQIEKQKKCSRKCLDCMFNMQAPRSRRNRKIEKIRIT